jgi:uncharacterized protein (TIGR03435 family)
MGGMGIGKKYVYRNFPLAFIFDTAYGPGGPRRVNTDLIPAIAFDWSKPAAPKPTVGFDLMLTLTNQPIEKLREEIMRQFKLTAHTEIRETNIYLLKVKHFPATGLTFGDKDSHSFDVGGGTTDSGFEIQNAEGVGNLARWLELKFDVPVLDETNLKEVYNISLKYDPQELLRLMAARGFDKRSEIDRELILKALQDQLGLELIPSREPIEMLVVEKVK